MTTPRLATLALASAALLAGCGSSAGTGQDASTFCREQAAVLAAKAPACASLDPAYASASYPLLLDCEALAELQAAGTLGFDETKVDACLAALQALGCRDLDLEDQTLPGPCQGVLVATVEPGGACHSATDVECVDGFCRIEACNAPGTCVAYAHAGDACLGATCAPGLFCNGATCEALVVHEAGVGEACGMVGAVCAEGTYCRYETLTHTLTCQPQVAIGESCSASYLACPRGSTCAPAGGGSVCAPSAALGAACAPGHFLCNRGLYCAPDDAAGLTGLCTAWSGVGGPCGFTRQGEPMECLDGWCDQPLINRLGAARLEAVSAASLPAGTCQPFTALGAACSSDFTGECGPRGTCVDGTCRRSYCGRRAKL